MATGILTEEHDLEGAMPPIGETVDTVFYYSLDILLWTQTLILTNCYSPHIIIAKDVRNCSGDSSQSVYHHVRLPWWKESGFQFLAGIWVNESIQ